MEHRQTIPIAGYRDEPLPNTFIRVAEGSRHLALLFPGFRHGVERPLLYYPGKLLLQQGADLLRVEYAYSSRADFAAAPEAEREAWLRADALAALHAGLAQGDYERLTVIGKSIGTYAMGHLLGNSALPPRTEWIWLTPLLGSDILREAIVHHKPASLFVSGSADRTYVPQALAETVAATTGQSLLIPGADHSLEIAGDVLASVRVLQQAVEAVAAFLLSSCRTE